MARREDIQGLRGVAVPASAAVILLLALVTPQSLVARATPRPRGAKSLPAVVAAVRAAERGAPIVSPLMPPLGSLLSDFYSFPDGCTPAGRLTAGKICRLGDTSSPKSIVVFGDSHAQMWMPAILRMAQRDHWLVMPLVKLSCIPRTWAAAGDCGDWYRWAKRRASELRPDVTLIIGSWAGTREPRQAIKPVARLSAAMRRSSASVIVVGDPASQRREPVDCLLAGGTMKACTSRQGRPQARTDRTIRSNALRSGVGFIDARGWLCARARTWGHGFLCPMVVNRTITFYDHGHITKTYALELAQCFRADFRRALFR